MRPPTVAIVGRPNVGKSSLFNRLLKHRGALVDPTAGITRDRLEAPLVWRGRALRLIDTGGVVWGKASSLVTAVQRQVARAIEEADLLVFVCDVGQGLVPLDHHVGELLRRAGKPVLVVANKADTSAAAERAVEFYAFGFEPPIAVSSSHGRGIGELLDAIVARLPAAPPAEEPSPTLTLAIVGRPNVGKSSLLNRWLGEERVTVDAAPGTTRDVVAVPVTRGRAMWQVVDTAGVRPRPKLKTRVEVVSVKRTLEMIEHADACLLTVDVEAGLVGDDLTLLGKILTAGRPCIVALNKWDRIEAGDPDAYARAFWRRAPFAAFVPVIATSALTGYHVDEALSKAAEVAEAGRRPIPREALQAATQVLQQGTGSPARLKAVRVTRLRQTAQSPVTLELAIRARRTVRLRRPDLAFVERLVRQHAALTGIPMRFVVRHV